MDAHTTAPPETDPYTALTPEERQSLTLFKWAYTYRSVCDVTVAEAKRAAFVRMLVEDGRLAG